MKKTVSGVVLEYIQGDIVRQPDIDAIVNAANRWLKTGGGVAGAIHRAAGPGLEQEAVPLGPISPGQAVLTGAHGLPNKYVIHCLGPVYGQDKPEAEILASCYRRALALAEEQGLRSVAFPAISTGIFGYPAREAAQVAVETIVGLAADLQTVELIRFVLFSAADLQIYEEVLAGLA